MILLPAIDLMDASVVRLKQGKAGEKTVYSDDPVAFAKKWEDEGGDYLHIVDLDAAFTGEQRNMACVAAIVAAVGIPVELGGGMRSRGMIDRAFEAGVSRVVVGTRAAESLDFIREIVDVYGGARVAVGIDARDGMVAVRGWTEESGVSASQLAQQVDAAGVGTIVYTDIATDGMLQGPNFAEIQGMLDVVDCKVVASGGVSSVEDVERLSRLPALDGVIIGKALYDGKLTLADIRHLSTGR